MSTQWALAAVVGLVGFAGISPAWAETLDLTCSIENYETAKGVKGTFATPLDQHITVELTQRTVVRLDVAEPKPFGPYAVALSDVRINWEERWDDTKTIKNRFVIDRGTGRLIEESFWPDGSSRTSSFGKCQQAAQKF